jgi:hypothetical protein
VSAAPADPAAPTGAGIAAAAGSVTPEKLPDILMSPDVTVLERAVRERPDVAAAVLEQMHYGQIHSAPPHGVHNGAAERDGQPDDGTGRAADGGADRVGGDRR